MGRGEKGHGGEEEGEGMTDREGGRRDAEGEGWREEWARRGEHFENKIEISKFQKKKMVLYIWCMRP